MLVYHFRGVVNASLPSQPQTVGNTAVLELYGGNSVFVSQYVTPPDTFTLVGDHGTYNTFSGVLLYANDTDTIFG